MPNLYQILNVDSTASVEDIAEAASKLSEEWDPNKFEDRKTRVTVSAVLQEIIDARDILLDFQKRREYDVRIGLADIVYKNLRVEQSGSNRDMPPAEKQSKDLNAQEDVWKLDKDGVLTVTPNAVNELKVDLQPDTNHNSKAVFYGAVEMSPREETRDSEKSESEKSSEDEKSSLEFNQEAEKLNFDDQSALKHRESSENHQANVVTISRNENNSTVISSQFEGDNVTGNNEHNPYIIQQVIPHQLQNIRIEDQTERWDYKNNPSFKDEKK
ncbi:j domain-containing protein [Trichonephila inaurata madagascariensis]|uniref:J domain-containing protein n=1 Tax=Trichonephila inaurata madagascariensis TaxID=2747483 RepID=A0A8X7CQ03_9ARAC|nr:j domain-containing protein [Trichonephila inaurata madagascariensis]